jgi:hypothetical protein
MKNNNMNINHLGEKLVKCNLNCAGINNNHRKGVIPRCLFLEKRNGKNNCIIVGLNPGKSSKKERSFYIKNGISFNSLKEYFDNNIKNLPYYKRTRELITKLGFNGDILWTELIKCECLKDKNINDVPIQTFRCCINNFLKKEIDVFNENAIFALGNESFKFFALSFPNNFIIGLPHPTGSYGGFYKLRNKVLLNSNWFKKEISKKRDSSGCFKAIQLS